MSDPKHPLAFGETPYNPTGLPGATAAAAAAIWCLQRGYYQAAGPLVDLAAALEDLNAVMNARSAVTQIMDSGLLAALRNDQSRSSEVRRHAHIGGVTAAGTYDGSAPCLAEDHNGQRCGRPLMHVVHVDLTGGLRRH